jgi:hypothetical protein
VSREAFEKWLRSEMPEYAGEGKAYSGIRKLFFKAWQAALQHSGEPVAWRLRRDGVDYGMTVYDKAQVGRYMQDGWQLVGELYTTPQPVVEVTDAQIREVFIANGFTIKDGQTDLKPYVYQAARALLSASHNPTLSTKPNQ